MPLSSLLILPSINHNKKYSQKDRGGEGGAYSNTNPACNTDINSIDARALPPTCHLSPYLEKEIKHRENHVNKIIRGIIAYGNISLQEKITYQKKYDN